MRPARLLPGILLLLTSPAPARDTSAPVAAATAPARTPAPKLIIVISVDQFSADLFAEYRSRFTGGFKRLLDGAVFPAGYQGHAATETCPGHSTMMTGDRPARTGIIANDWFDFGGVRPGQVYCTEDESKGTYRDYVASDVHLRVPTLGERMKAADPRVRTVSVAGKDRAAILMGGHTIDALWFWRDGKGFMSYVDRAVPASIARANAAAETQIAKPGAAFAEPGWCKAIDRPVLANGRIVGNGRFARPAKTEGEWKSSPAFDTAIFGLATNLVRDMRLGRGPATDVLTIGASATDYVGHAYGTEGSEMCIQMASLDRTLGNFFAMLDKTGVDYVVALTGDHGGNDIPERQRERGVPSASRVESTLLPGNMGKSIAAAFELGGPLLYGGVNGDIWINATLTPAQRAQVLDEAVSRYRASAQVETVFTKADVAAAPLPSGPPESWTLLQRARASFDPQRSGDFLVFLKPYITAISPRVSALGATATHGSPWDYDRRVPILFWRKGMKGFEQPLSVETIDMMPSLAALIGFALAPGDVDGRCLDLDGGPGSTCP